MAEEMLADDRRRFSGLGQREYSPHSFEDKQQTRDILRDAAANTAKLIAILATAVTLLVVGALAAVSILAVRRAVSDIAGATIDHMRPSAEFLYFTLISVEIMNSLFL